MKDVLASFKKELQEDDPFITSGVVETHPVVEKLLEKGFTGNKGPGGFYQTTIDDGNEIIKALNPSDMSYYDFNKVDLPIARQVEKGFKHYLMKKVNMANMLSLFFQKSLIIALIAFLKFHQK